jgi:hypothetical protein
MPISWGARRVSDVAVLDFRARVTAPALILERARALIPAPPAWAAVASAPVATSFVVEPQPPVPGWWRVTRDGATLYEAGRAADLVGYLVWAINWAAVEALASRYLLFHAGAVTNAGRGFLLPGDSGSGKSTLVAGLLGAGFDYVSDDVAPVEPASLTLLPFAKSVSLRPGARRPLATWHPHLHERSRATDVEGAAEWFLTPEASSWPPGPAPVRYVVLPQYAAGARTQLTPIRRSAALERLIAQSFSQRELGQRGIERTVAMLREADCFALRFGSLRRAVDLLRRLAALTGAGDPRPPGGGPSLPPAAPGPASSPGVASAARSRCESAAPGR